MKVGVIGCGAISGIYFQNARTLPGIEVAACADLDLERAKAAAERYGIPLALGTEELLAHPDVEVVLNLTTPAGHAPINTKALEAGKHVYVEKPLAIDLAEGEAQMALAGSKGLLVGCAPDTVLGAGIQACRKLVDDGAIGRVVGGNAAMLSPGVEMWHPNPRFYYEKGGGPMFDMGPYYLSALVTLLGPIGSVMGLARKGLEQRLITSEPFKGGIIDVAVPTHVAGLLEFEQGAVITMTTSFDTHGTRIPPIELYGTEGSLLVPDPNTFGGPVLLRRKGERDWTDIPLTHGHAENSRGIGLADLADAAREGRPPRAGGALALHVLEAMHAFHHASDQRRAVDIRNRCDRPQAMPPAAPPDEGTA